MINYSDHIFILTNIKTLYKREVLNISKAFKIGKTPQARKRLKEFIFVKSAYMVLSCYNGGSTNNWITDNEYNNLVDYLNKYFNSCNLRTQNFACTANINKGLFYQDNNIIYDQNGNVVNPN